MIAVVVRIALAVCGRSWIVTVERHADGGGYLIPTLVVEEIMDVPEAERWHHEDVEHRNEEPEIAEWNDNLLNEMSPDGKKQPLVELESLRILEDQDASGVKGNSPVV